MFAHGNEVPPLRLKACGEFGLDGMEELFDGLWLGRHCDLVECSDGSLLVGLMVS